jgi:hypothetical protein
MASRWVDRAHSCSIDRIASECLGVNNTGRDSRCLEQDYSTVVNREPQFRLNNYQSDISHIRDGDCDSLHCMFVLFDSELGSLSRDL